MPIALRIPISRVLSVTTMVSVLTMLNAATRTISSRMTVIPNFSRLAAPGTATSSAAASPRCDREIRACRTACARHAGACHRSTVFTSTPVTALTELRQLLRGGNAMITYALSYSYIPVSKMPVTSYLPDGRGERARHRTDFRRPGRDQRYGVGHDDVEPRRELANRAPRRSVPPLASRNEKSPPVAVPRMDVTRLQPAESAGTIPITNTPS